MKDLSGFTLFPGRLDRAAQTALVDAVLTATRIAPFHRQVTPGGKAMSVEMTGLARSAGSPTPAAIAMSRAIR